MQNEIWKEINGYEGRIYVSTEGRVKSNNKLRKLRRSGNGYFDISLHHKENGVWQRKSIPIHRLVAETFIPNPENKRTVNHKNGIKTDNRLENLEWCTFKENSQHSFDVLNRKANQQNERKKYVMLIDELGNTHHYKGIRVAGRAIGMPYQSIQQSIKKGHKVKGYLASVVFANLGDEKPLDPTKGNPKRKAT